MLLAVAGLLTSMLANEDYVVVKSHRADATQILAKFAPGVPQQASLARLNSSGLSVRHQFSLVPGLVVLDVAESRAAVAAVTTSDPKVKAEKLLARIDALKKTGLFAYVEPDYIKTKSLTPTDAAFVDGTLWALRNTGQNGGVAGADIGAVGAWDLTTGSTNVMVAVIDSGIRYTHKELASQMWRNPGEIAGNGLDDDGDGYVDNVFGINAITGSGDPMDDDDHGTHVAGTIGAAANDGNRHVGVAWRVRLMACKFLGSNGGKISQEIKCLEFAVAKGARILSASFGDTAFSQAEYDAIKAAGDRDVLLVAAAGNDGVNTDRNPHYPSSYALDNIISVAALDRKDQLADFSNYGQNTVHLGAPGVGIFSCTAGSDTEYKTFEGTSMATPHVSGVAALLLSRYPGIALQPWRNLLLSTTVKVNALGNKSATGGRVNAQRALTAVPDGLLEVFVTPATNTPLMQGVDQVFTVKVTDIFAITNATVNAVLSGGGAAGFADNGQSPDVATGDGIYTANLHIPLNQNTLTVSLAITAPGKQNQALTLNYPLVPPVQNNNFAARTPLTGTNLQVNAANLGATKETGEPDHAGRVGGKSVWWSWTAANNGNVIIATTNTTFDTLLAVYTGSALNALASVAGNDDDPNDGTASLVSFTATAGTTYQIAVDGYHGAAGLFTLTLSLGAPSVRPVNDNFAARLTLTGTNVNTSASNRGATKEPGEPDHADNGGGASVWWSWTAPANGRVKLKTANSTFDTLLAVYTGSTMSGLASVAGNDDDPTGGRTSAVSFSATAGTTYQIAVDGYDGAAGSIALSLVFVVPTLSNDNFANRIVLSGTNITTAGSNVDATKEAGEPNHAQNSGGKSVWWTWTAPASGTVVCTTTGSSFDTLLAVYSGSSLASLVALASNDDFFFDDNTSQVEFDVTAGMTCQIAVDGYQGSSGTAAEGDITLGLTLAPPRPRPANDNFASRTVLSGTNVVVTGSNVDASQESGEPAHAGETGGHSLWWSWTAPATGNLTITTAGSGLDTLLAVYTGNSITNLKVVASNDDDPAGSTTSYVNFNTQAGTNYLIAVDGFEGDTGLITLRLTLGAYLPPPANDLFSNRLPITGANVDVTGSNRGASVEPDEPAHASRSISKSVWWSWTAPASGPYTVRTVASDFDTLLAVYTGTTLSNLTLVASNDDDLYVGSTSRADFQALAGVTYQMAIDGYGGTAGNIRLTIGPSPSTTVIYQTTFDAAQGYAANRSLAGQNGWKSMGSGGSLIQNGLFPGYGQQATLGTTPPSSTDFGLDLWHPLDYTPGGNASHLVKFTVLMAIQDSTNHEYDDFEWRIYNRADHWLFGLDFDNADNQIYYTLDDASDYTDTGLSYTNRAMMELAIYMDFTSNKWSAFLDGKRLATRKAMTNTRASLDLGDIDAVWSLQQSVAGNNSMIFDNYSVTAEPDRSVIIQAGPQSLAVNAGGSATWSVRATGLSPLRYQWRFNGANLPGATNATLALNAVTSSQAGAYQVVVFDAASGFAISAAASLTVTGDPPPQPQIAIQRTGSQIEIRFQGILQQAPEVNGPYADVPGATSPLSITPSQSRQFWRARNP